MSQEKTQETKFQYWKIIYIPILALLIPVALKIYDKLDKPKEVPMPRFSIDGSHTLDKDTPFVIIKPENKAAQRERNLDVKIGNLKRNDLCQVYTKNGELRWQLKIDLIEPDILKSKFKNGENEIQIGFIDKNLWDTHTIFISNLNDFLEENEVDTPLSKPKTKRGTPPQNKDKVQPQTTKKIPVSTNKGNKDYYEAKGFCVIDRDKFKNETQAILMARKCASIVAKAELLETIKGVKIEEEALVEDLMLNNLKIKAEVDDVIKSAYIVGDPFVGKDMVEVVVRVKKQTLQTVFQ